MLLEISQFFTLIMDQSSQILSSSILLGEDHLDLNTCGSLILYVRIWFNRHGTFTLRALELSNVRKEVLSQNKKVFGRVECEIKLKQAQLQNIQNSINSVKDVRKEKATREELEVLLNREELLWAQKARSDWTLLGDRNTRFFQIVVKQRKVRSIILHLKDRGGNLIKNPKDIENILVNHFKLSYVAASPTSVESILEELNSLPIPQLSVQQSLSLNRPVTNEEIKSTVFQLGPHKALGLDGIPAFFFQEYWSTVKTDIFNTVQAFFQLGSLFKSLNHTYITLLGAALP